MKKELGIEILIFIFIFQYLSQGDDDKFVKTQDRYILSSMENFELELIHWFQAWRKQILTKPLVTSQQHMI